MWLFMGMKKSDQLINLAIQDGVSFSSNNYCYVLVILLVYLNEAWNEIYVNSTSKGKYHRLIGAHTR